MSIHRSAMQKLQELPGFKPCGKDEFEAKCPGHEDKKASLSIGIGDDGRILLKCHAGCNLEGILNPIGLKPKDLFPENGNGYHAERRIVATYNYTDAEGSLSYQVVRYDPKGFRQRRPDGKGGWIWKIEGLKRLLYNLPEVLKAQYVWIPEGERDVESLRKIGLVATCNSGGAGHWSAELAVTRRALYL